jgi:hypothetical protein
MTRINSSRTKSKDSRMYRSGNNSGPPTDLRAGIGPDRHKATAAHPTGIDGLFKVFVRI